MEPGVNISYTLRLALDELKSRLSQLTQNGKFIWFTVIILIQIAPIVTSYDHLMYVEHELRDESPFHAVREHYSKM